VIVPVLSAGANDVYRNNPKEALIHIIDLMQKNGSTNIGIPHRYDLDEYLYVNKAIQSFNYKLKKVAKIFNYISVMECNYNGEYFTKHSMHLLDSRF
jgi:hypothetical protein